MSRRGFTLIEVIVATMLTTVLLGIVLAATASLSRDRKRLAAANHGTRPAEVHALLDLLRQDLTNARSFASSEDGRVLEITGYAGLSRDAMAPVGRLAHVTYEVRTTDGPGPHSCLVRSQRYLDDPVRPDRWTELVAVGVQRLSVSAASPQTGVMPAQVAVRIDLSSQVIEQKVWLR